MLISLFLFSFYAEAAPKNGKTSKKSVQKTKKEEKPLVKAEDPYGEKALDEAMKYYYDKDFYTAMTNIKEIGEKTTTPSVKKKIELIIPSLEELDKIYNDAISQKDPMEKIKLLKRVQALDDNVTDGELFNDLRIIILNAYVEGGKIYEKREDYELAKLCFKKALALDPENNSAQEALQNFFQKGRTLYMKAKSLEERFKKDAKIKYEEVLEILDEDDKYYQKAKQALKKL